MCKCPKGKVFYGAKFQWGTSKLNTFEGMMESEYAALKNPHGGEVRCEATNFIGGSRLPTFEKDCYCDDKDLIDEAIVDDEIYYWEGVFEEE